jgi:hypothetical protein
MNQKRREQQLEFLDKCDSRESLGKTSTYLITCKELKKTETCQCAGTAMMLLDTQFKDHDVWVQKVN